MAECEAHQPSQQGIQSPGIDYYDIMVLGMTGLGKSTTADKILVAKSNPEDKVTLEDYSLWSIDEKAYEKDRIKTRIKNLVFFGDLENSHKEIKDFRESGMHIAESTKECEAYSNDKTKVRVLDVPGFFDKEFLAASNSSIDAGHKIVRENLNIMRRILHIQMAKSMRFRRVLYFLPCRGPLQRAHALLQLDLKILAHYFGLPIFKSLVLVATIPGGKLADFLAKASDEIAFDKNQRQETMDSFLEALQLAFPDQKEAVQQIEPPLILLRLTDTCEDTLQKIKKAPVVNEYLRLELNSNTCGKCGAQTGLVQGEKVVCYYSHGPIPYSESKCHPNFKQVYGLTERVKQVVSFGLYKPLFQEVCVKCECQPHDEACTKIGEKFQYGSQVPITVDHDNKVRLPENGENAMQSTNEDPRDWSEQPPSTSLQVGLGYEAAPSFVNTSHIVGTVVPELDNLEIKET